MAHRNLHHSTAVRPQWPGNIAFVPAYNDQGRSESELRNASAAQIAPYGEWWADWASASNEWIAGGDETGGAGAPYDYALLHVKPAQGSTSLEETRGSSGGGWFRVAGGKTELVSNTSIGPAGDTWLAGPQLGRGAQALYENMSKRYGGR